MNNPVFVFSVLWSTWWWPCLVETCRWVEVNILLCFTGCCPYLWLCKNTAADEWYKTCRIVALARKIHGLIHNLFSPLNFGGFYTYHDRFNIRNLWILSTKCICRLRAIIVVKKIVISPCSIDRMFFRMKAHSTVCETYGESLRKTESTISFHRDNTTSALMVSQRNNREQVKSTRLPRDQSRVPSDQQSRYPWATALDLERSVITRPYRTWSCNS